MKINDSARCSLPPGDQSPVSVLPPLRRRFGAGRWLLAPGLWVLLAGCSIPLPQAQPDRTRYYVLQPPAGPVATAERAALPVIRLQAVDVPAYLSDRPLAVRRGENEIHYLESAQWAEPLDQGVERNLRAGLAAVPGLSVVSRYDASATWDYTLKVRVTACEGAEDKRVQFAATWVLEPAPKSDRPRKSGQFTAHDLTWDGRSPDSLVAALSQGISQLCAALAGAVEPEG